MNTNNQATTERKTGTTKQATKQTREKSFELQTQKQNPAECSPKMAQINGGALRTSCRRVERAHGLKLGFSSMASKYLTHQRVCNRSQPVRSLMSAMRKDCALIPDAVWHVVALWKSVEIFSVCVGCKFTRLLSPNSAPTSPPT